MIGLRRTYKRMTTTERSVAAADRAATFEGERFRVEVIKTDGGTETTIYSRDHAGSIEVEESIDGNFRLNGIVSPP